MIIHDFDVLCAPRSPAEAHAELIVHADTVLPGAVALECFEPVPWRHPEIFQPARDLQLPQLASRNGLDVREPPDPPAFRESFRVGAPERPDHERIITSCVINVKRDASLPPQAWVGAVTFEGDGQKTRRILPAPDVLAQEFAEELPFALSPSTALRTGLSKGEISGCSCFDALSTNGGIVLRSSGTGH